MRCHRKQNTRRGHSEQEAGWRHNPMSSTSSGASNGCIALGASGCGAAATRAGDESTVCELCASHTEHFELRLNGVDDVLAAMPSTKPVELPTPLGLRCQCRGIGGWRTLPHALASLPPVKAAAWLPQLLFGEAPSELTGDFGEDFVRLCDHHEARTLVLDDEPEDVERLWKDRSRSESAGVIGERAGLRREKLP